MLGEGTLLRLLPETGCFSLYATGCSEREVSKFIITYLKSGMTFIDVGPYVGEHSVRASRIIGNSGRVYAFEPIPDTFQVLTQNIRSNRLRNVICESVALSDLCQEALYECRRYATGSALARVTANHEIDKVNPVVSIQSVNTMSLDEYARRGNLGTLT